MVEFRSHLDCLTALSTAIDPELRAALASLLEALNTCTETHQADAWRSHCLALTGLLLQRSPSSTAPSLRQLMCDHIVRGVASDEHPYLSECRRRGMAATSPVLKSLFKSDLRALQGMAQSRLLHLLESLTQSCAPAVSESQGAAMQADKTDSATVLPWDLSSPTAELHEALCEARDWGETAEAVGEFVGGHGEGLFQGTPAFFLSADARGVLGLTPVREFASFDLEWLQGNESRIAIVEANTEHLLAGRPAHNVLIWGPRGCGKSSLIRGLITKHYNRGLRGIQVPQAHCGRLTELYALVRGRRECFIAVIDNVSLDPNDPAFRQLASALEGGLELPPANCGFR